MGYYKAALFNGLSNYILLPKNSIFDRAANDFSFNCWFNAYSLLPNQNSHLFGCISPQGANVAGILFQTQEGTNFNNFVVYTNGAAKFGVTNLLMNNWYMLTVTRTGTSLKFYLNNSLLSTVTILIGDVFNFSGNWNCTIGYGKHTTTNYFFNGAIQELSFFNRVLTANEISYVYNSGNGIYADPTDVNANNPFHNGGMLSVYHLNGDLLDISGNVLNGVAMNGLYFVDGKIVNPNAITPVHGKWYKIDYLIPADLTNVYIRLAANEYPPIKCIYYQSTQTFVDTVTGASYLLPYIFEWSLV